jgi:carboxypeptidase family protein
MAKGLNPLRLFIIVAFTAVVAIRMTYWLREDKKPADQPTGTAQISGRVVDSKGQPIATANVRIYSRAMAVFRATVSKADGSFSFTKLPATEYQVQAFKRDFIGSAVDAAPSVTVGEGQRIDNVQITLALGGLITGTLYDESGRPVSGRFVRALHRSHPSDGLVADSILGRTMMAGTNSQGHFRLAGLTTDDYYVAVSLDPSETVRIYYPSAIRLADAKTVSVVAGEERTGIDLKLRPVPRTSIGGMVMFTNRPAAAGVELVRADDNRRPIFGSSKVDGRFTFDNVVASPYWLVAHTVIGGLEHWGSTEVDASERAVQNATIVLRPDAVVTGVVALSADADAVKLVTLHVLFHPADERTAAGSNYQRVADVSTDGGFTIQLPAGRYNVSDSYGPSLQLARADVDGHPLLGEPLEVRAGAAVTMRLTLERRR